MALTVSSEQLKYELVQSWEQLPQRWSHPDVVGACTDDEDNVYLFCRGEHPVIIYDSQGRLLDSWGEGRFTYRTHGIYFDKTADGDGLLLVDDGGNSVGRYSLDGKLLDEIGPSGKPSDTGYGNGDLNSVKRGAPPYNRPTKAVRAPSGDIYVSDGYGNARVHRFSAAGELLQSWGAPGSEHGEFKVPHGVWVHDDGRVFVADRHNDRIQIFSPTGEFLAEWLDVQRPQDIFMDKNGLIYVAELVWQKGMTSARRGPIMTEEPGRVSIYDQEGNVLLRWSDPDGAKAGYFVAPHGICVDSEGSIYVAEVTDTIGVSRGVVPEGTHTFQKFARV